MMRAKSLVALSIGDIKAQLTEPPFSAPPPLPPPFLLRHSADNHRVTGFSAGTGRLSREMPPPQDVTDRPQRPRRRHAASGAELPRRTGRLPSGARPSRLSTVTNFLQGP